MNETNKSNELIEAFDPNENVNINDIEVDATQEIVSVKSNKPTLLQQWKNKFIEPFETKPLFISTAPRLQKLAGITPSPVARLLFKNEVEIKLTDYPTLFELLRYKICGFKYEVLKVKE
jgi:hypothetical protein